MKNVSLYLVYDVLAQDVINIFPCPSDNAAILGFANSKKTFEEKGYNPRLVQLYKICDLSFEPLSRSANIVLDGSKYALLICDLLNAPSELERITNELLDSGSLNLSEVDD